MLRSQPNLPSMILNPERIPTREKLILAGLYLSKYNSLGLRKLGFKAFAEAFNVIGYALGSQPASIKNYRDEFDPIVSKRRKGWRKRPTRAYCLKVFDAYNNLDLELFAGLIRSFVGYDENAWSELQENDKRRESESRFAERLITGLAAERYFESVQPSLPELKDYVVENTTRLGCGYDFLLTTARSDHPLAVEVKGLKGRTGSVSLTPKEYQTATKLQERFYLFVVKDFCRSPFHQIFQNPLAGAIDFMRAERVTVHVSWVASI
jgi:hypothetical protein